MAVERAVGALRCQEERQGRRDQPLVRGGDEVRQARFPHRRVQGGEVILAEGGRNIHRRGSWIGLDHALRTGPQGTSSFRRKDRASLSPWHRTHPHGADHPKDLRGDQGQIASGGSAPAPGSVHPAAGGGVGRLADDGDGRLRATHRGGLPGDPAGARARVAQGSAPGRGTGHPLLRRLPIGCQPSGSGWWTSATARVRPRPTGCGFPLRRLGGRRLPARLAEGGRRCPAAPSDAPAVRRPARLARPPMALQGYLWRARGLRCEPDQIVVVNGSQQGLDLCARLLLDPGTGSRWRTRATASRVRSSWRPGRR